MRHEFHVSHASRRCCLRQFWIVFCGKMEEKVVQCTNEFIVCLDAFEIGVFVPTILSVSILSPLSASSRMCRRKLRRSRRVIEFLVEPIGSRATVFLRTSVFQSSFLHKFKAKKSMNCWPQHVRHTHFFDVRLFIAFAMVENTSRTSELPRTASLTIVSTMPI